MGGGGKNEKLDRGNVCALEKGTGLAEEKRENGGGPW